MTASIWIAKRLSAWILLSLLGLLLLVFFVESIEQGRMLSEGRSVGDLVGVLADRIPLLMRDLLAPLIGLSVALFVVRMRHRQLTGLEASGLGRMRLFLTLGGVCLFWSLLFLHTTESVLATKQIQPGDQSWALLDGVATRVGLDDSGELELLELHPESGSGVSLSRPAPSSQETLYALLAAPRPAMAPLASLRVHPHPKAAGWYVWRQISRFTPCLLALLMAAFCLALPLGAGSASALALGLGLSTQMTGSLLADSSVSSVFSLSILCVAGLALARLSARVDQPSM